MSKTQRLISVFRKKEEDLVKEINIDFISLQCLQQIFKPVSEDIEMLCVYAIGSHEAKELQKFMAIDFDFERYLYQLDCFIIACDE